MVIFLFELVRWTKMSGCMKVKAINTSTGKNLWSWPEDADISGKGADDHIGLCVSTGSLAYS